MEWHKRSIWPMTSLLMQIISSINRQFERVGLRIQYPCIVNCAYTIINTTAFSVSKINDKNVNCSYNIKLAIIWKTWFPMAPKKGIIRHVQPKGRKRYPTFGEIKYFVHVTDGHTYFKKWLVIVVYIIYVTFLLIELCLKHVFPFPCRI